MKSDNNSLDNDYDNYRKLGIEQQLSTVNCPEYNGI